MKEIKYIKISGINEELVTYVSDEKINNEIFRRNIVVDFRYLDMDKIKYLFENFKEFQFNLVEFFKWFDDKRKNDRLLFLYDDRIKDTILEYEYSISRDLHFYRKEFIDELQFKKIEEKEMTLSSGNNIKVGNVNVNIEGFNLIFGINGSGKTILMKQLSEYFDVPIFNCYSKDIIKLDNNEIFMDYYRKLTGKSDITNYTGIDDVYYGICNGLTYGVSTGNVVLFDDLGWGLVDNLNKIKIIDMLNNYSYDNGIVMTSCKNDVKKLVMNTVYNPNIIDL